MKKIIIFILIFLIVCPFVNFPFYMLSNLSFYDGDSLSEDISANLQCYYNEEYMDMYIEYYENNMEDVLVAMTKIEFVPVDNIQTVILLAFRDIDIISRMASMPMRQKSDNGARLNNIQFFTLDEKNYMLCYYSDSEFCYKLYSYERNERLESALQKDCFLTDGIFSSAKSRTVTTAAYTLVSRYIFVVIFAFMCFFPYLFTANKKIDKKVKKRLTTLAKTGVVLVPILAVFSSLYIYRFSVTYELLSDFLIIIKGILLRVLALS